MRTFLLSPPGPNWQIRGGRNFKSNRRAETDPKKARAEWQKLRDAITARGARVVELPPPDRDPPLTGLVYTANLGARFGELWLAARMSVPHRETDPEIAMPIAGSLGLRVERIPVRWEGQAEVCTLPGGRFVLTYGVRSEAASIEEVRRHLPVSARVLAARIVDPFFHGDTCLSSLATPKGHLLLVYEGALADREDCDALRQLARPDVEIVPISRADALAYAANALLIGGDLLAPAGLSQALKDTLTSHGLRLVELSFDELFGKGGGGPRCMVNDLGDL